MPALLPRRPPGLSKPHAPPPPFSATFSPPRDEDKHAEDRHAFVSCRGLIGPGDWAKEGGVLKGVEARHQKTKCEMRKQRRGASTFFFFTIDRQALLIYSFFFLDHSPPPSLTFFIRALFFTPPPIPARDTKRDHSRVPGPCRRRRGGHEMEVPRTRLRRRIGVRLGGAWSSFRGRARRLCGRL